jgi:beta-galactosidase GanA
MANEKPHTPYLRKTNKTWELIVDSKPYLVLGAELQNSSMSSAHYMNEVWQNIKDMGVNTVLGPICWEDIEPEEDKFDFGEMDEIIASAALHGLRLILLWFGSFKNGMNYLSNAQSFPVK